ncbi:hypothetical protein CDAR_6651 [Caerostris darwini]|uniref:Uncharacterized protein n=1 Tax=Caerostris darwini TaxID=1538125 RepID=A0AAV4S7T1_9ARAC|nr:hypothetical protein CDAR_6651 [Caerostris darwini]
MVMIGLVFLFLQISTELTDQYLQSNFQLTCISVHGAINEVEQRQSEDMIDHIISLLTSDFVSKGIFLAKRNFLQINNKGCLDLDIYPISFLALKYAGIK